MNLALSCGSVAEEVVTDILRRGAARERMASVIMECIISPKRVSLMTSTLTVHVHRVGAKKSSGGGCVK